MNKQSTILGYISFFILIFTQYAFGYSESPLLTKLVQNGKLPPVELRLPKTPRIIDFSSRNLSIGKYGGTIKMLMARAKDARQMTVYGYARLLIFKPKTFKFQPDILESMVKNFDSILDQVINGPTDIRFLLKISVIGGKTWLTIPSCRQ